MPGRNINRQSLYFASPFLLVTEAKTLVLLLLMIMMMIPGVTD
jgi:hypothetical protein